MYDIDTVVRFRIPGYGIPAVGCDKGFIEAVILHKNYTSYIINSEHYGVLIVDEVEIYETYDCLTVEDIKKKQAAANVLHYNDADHFLLRDFYKMSAQNQEIVRSVINALN